MNADSRNGMLVAGRRHHGGRSARRWWPAIVVLGFLLPLAAWARVEGSTLATACTNERGDAFCAGYVEGVFDGLVGLKGLGRFSVCLPANVTDDQLVAVAQGYLRTHPDEAHLQGIELLVKAWSERWGCGLESTTR